MLGYYRDTRPGMIEMPRSVIGEGWYDTGDVIEVDESGIVAIIGRSRRFAKVAGEMVSLDVMEEVAYAASPGHRHAGIVLLQDDGMETTVLFTTDALLTRARLAEAARACGAPGLAVARRLVTLAEIPVMFTGKTDYVSLKSLAENDSYGRLLSVAAGRTITATDEQQAESGSLKAGSGRPAPT